ncbi:MAG TPA: topoisomerase C-terminal repeat-containing protein, partial [Acidimicrobiales bacterium]
KPSGDRVLGSDPETELPVIARAGRFGPYVQLGEASSDAKAPKPKTASLFKDMQLETVTLEQALELLKIPRTLGKDPADGQEVTAQNGRFGPYVKKGAETRSLDSEERLLTVTLEEALALLAEPRKGRGAARGAAAAPLRELGADPESGGTIVLREGRFGPYVTDGTTNASLRKGDTIDDITPERAVELLADRRAKGPATPKKRAARAPRKAKGKA